MRTFVRLISFDLILEWVFIGFSLTVRSMWAQCGLIPRASHHLDALTFLSCIFGSCRRARDRLGLLCAGRVDIPPSCVFPTVLGAEDTAVALRAGASAVGQLGSPVRDHDHVAVAVAQQLEPSGPVRLGEL